MSELRLAIVGDDGSERARVAAEWARALASATGLELAVIGVVETDAPGAAHAVQEDLERRVGEPARARGLSCSCRSVTGEARRVLTAQIEKLDAGLVIVGNTGRWRVARPPIGSVAGHLVHHSPCPVVVVPGPGGPVAGGRIVVGVDGSDGSATAAEWSAALADRTQASLTAVFVFPPLADSYPRPADVSNWHYIHEPEAREIVESLEVAGTDVDLRLIGANRVEGLLEVADEVDASLVAVGTRGFGGFHRLLLGGTALQLLHHSSRPVALVPSGRGKR